DVKPPFPRIAYAEAMERFGIDKPDMRFGLELKNLTAAFAGTSFKVFAEILARAGSVYGINVPGDHALSRRELDELAESVKSRHAMGLAWIKAGELQTDVTENRPHFVRRSRDHQQRTAGSR